MCNYFLTKNTYACVKPNASKRYSYYPIGVFSANVQSKERQL